MKRIHGMTIIELLVVIVIIIALFAILMPALQGAGESARRATCANNLRQIHMGVTTHATDHRNVLPSAYRAEPNGPHDQTALDYSTARQLRDVGLAEGTRNDPQMPSLWRCPSSEFFPSWEDAEDRFELGYQYMGGIDRWHNDQGEFDAVSPIRMDQARSTWVLAADAPSYEDGWHDENEYRTHLGRDGAPEGQNQAYVDGSVDWVERERLFFVHSPEPGAYQLFMYQDARELPDDFDLDNAQRMPSE